MFESYTDTLVCKITDTFTAVHRDIRLTHATLSLVVAQQRFDYRHIRKFVAYITLLHPVSKDIVIDNKYFFITITKNCFVLSTYLFLLC